MKLRSLLVLATMFFSVATSAQLYPNQVEKEDLVTKLPFYKKMKYADELFRAGSFHNAEKYYRQLRQEQPRNAYIAQMIAECCSRNRDYPQAAGFYHDAYVLGPELYPIAPYFEALNLKSNGQYDEALERFKFFLKVYKGKDKKMRLTAQRQIEGCEMAIKSMANPDNYLIRNAGPNVNTAFTESSPMPLGDTALMFATMNTNRLIESNRDKRAEYVSRFMWSPKEYDFTKVKDTFEVSMPFNDGRFNDPKFHISNGCWSPGRDRFYFTKCLEEDSLNISCKIYVSEFAKGQWGAPKPMDDYINDPTGSSTTPAIAMVGKKEVLFFSSSRPQGGAGGFDIWYTVYDPKQKTYRRPQNCGKRVNTNKDETTPWYDSKEGALYWASNGLVGLGGFDVFKGIGGPTRYTSIRNMGFPVNSPADDFNYIQDDNGTGNGYVVSNRLGSAFIKNPTCCDDIWRVQKDPMLKVCGRVIDAATGEVIPEAVVRMNDDKDGSAVDTLYSRNGNFCMDMPLNRNLTITADKAGYVSGRANLSTINIRPDAPESESAVDVIMERITSNYDFHVQKVYFNFDDGRFQTASLGALDSLSNFMKDNPSLSVEVFANTDGKGSDQYNDSLSTARAAQVIDYLVSKNIDRARMVARPMGKRNLEMPEGGPDDAPNRQANRRVYFRIIGELPGTRIIYDNNRPEYIDKTSSSAEKRARELEVQPNDEADQGPVPAESVPNSVNK
ncbi:MAG: outer rane peptidoglycan-associated protein [Bacteroidota bacterium]|jgi:outer membrane protein OmpA-like peptidoglycan-associated protein